MYRELAEKGASQVLSIHISESLSATANVARTAAQQASEVPVTVLDSRQLSLGTGLLAERSAVAHLGRLLTLKPILRMYEGEASADKRRTREHAWARMIAWLEELAPLEGAALVHTNALPWAQERRARVSHLLPVGETLFVNVTPVLGAHLGPVAVGFACVRAAS